MDNTTNKISRRVFMATSAGSAAVMAVPGAASAANGKPAAAVPTSNVQFEVNGKRHAFDLDTRTTLLTCCANTCT